ncbi:hypothetical protein P154DRAFT_250797 [Amniculicola lignicola CBS 123094]|uniref:F-box domain-containing protein n=1 Tax=Amniculicola lignicola CBS 123094 TaxID=1392246 RepID=A0A6A5WB73_9PLEO|nr:hypothetical protein P154DRAFT_250797 [Amniculicola lignicola CBS 123094]
MSFARPEKEATLIWKMGQQATVRSPLICQFFFLSPLRCFMLRLSLTQTVQWNRRTNQRTSQRTQSPYATPNSFFTQAPSAATDPGLLNYPTNIPTAPPPPPPPPTHLGTHMRRPGLAGTFGHYRSTLEGRRAHTAFHLRPELTVSSRHDISAEELLADRLSNDAPQSSSNDIDLRDAFILPDPSGTQQQPEKDIVKDIESQNLRSRLQRSTTMKRNRDKFEQAEARDLGKTLNSKGAVSAFLYHRGTSDPDANDVWPSFRNENKAPARYCLLPVSSLPKGRNATWKRDSVRPTKMLKIESHLSIESSGERGWPAGIIPTEIYEMISDYLDRDDIKSMRLVCREFDRHVSQVLFKTVVVPFNTEIYGMLGQEHQHDAKGKGKGKGKKKANAIAWNNSNDDDVYEGHGLDVFRGFGKHILKFGMSFEVNEDALANPPDKVLTESHTSFWGSYDWPYEEYRRFDDVAGLESAADETPRMKTAFSELTKVQELALSVDSGLGWLNGPDKSIRARILQRPLEVFGATGVLPDRRAQAQRELWDYIDSCHQTASADVKLATLYKLEAGRTLHEVQQAEPFLQEAKMPFLDQNLIHESIPHDAAQLEVPASLDDPDVLDRFVLSPPSPGAGIMFTSNVQPNEAGQIMSPIIPTHLTKAQKEWLLETEWAQRAFLSSYMLSIIDNPATFAQVHTLNIAQLPDRYIGSLNRRDFWDALSGLNSLTLQVIPGWRTVYKDGAGFVDTPKINPSSGIDPFYDLLRNMLASRKNIKKLTIGWISGGEHAEGMHSRNKLLLPAPLLPGDQTTSNDIETIREHLARLPYVEELTLKNCWVTPPALLQLIKQLDKLTLRKLNLKSVSLTAILRTQPIGVQVNQAAQQLALLAHHAGGGFLQNGNNFGANIPNLGQAQQAQQNQAVTPQQLLQAHIQSLQNGILQMQTQLNAGNTHVQHQIAALQGQLINQINLQNQMPIQNNHHQAQPNAWAHPQQGAPPPAVNSQPMQSSPSVLQTQPREGSWVNIIDIISPGQNLSDFGSTHSQADSDRMTSLDVIEFTSCGYAKLPHSIFDQSVLEPANPLPKHANFTKRYVALAPAMLSAKWPLLGEIVQEFEPNELITLQAGWGLTTGWDNAFEAMAPEFDGLASGGFGRFTGMVASSDRVAPSS